MSQLDKHRFGRMLSSSASGAAFLIMIQLTSRLVTFIANQLILRELSPAIIGIAAQLELYLSTILYFSRESIRVATKRQPLGAVVEKDEDSGASPNHGVQARDSTASQSVVNISYLSISMGIPMAMILTMFYVHFASEKVSEKPYYHISVAITGIASLVELGVEPFFAVVQQHMLYEKRALVELSAAFLKSATVCTTFVWASKTGFDVGILPFALGHLCHSLILAGGYAATMRSTAKKGGFSFLPMRIQSSKRSRYLAGRFSYQLISLSANVFLQSAVKHLLTQGDSMILAALSSLEDQGIYSLASNYGGLVARIIFQPVEESSRTLFASLLNPGEVSVPDPHSVNVAKTHLVDISRAYGLLSIIIFPLAPSLVPRLLHLLGGRRWTSIQVDRLLVVYCYYIPFLAFNGITEAFVSSAASPLELRKQTGWMGAFSASFILAAYIFLKICNMGAQGLVWANIVNMAVRTVWSYEFIDSYLRRHQNRLVLAELSPRLCTQFSGILATFIMVSNPGNLSDDDFYSNIRAIALNAAYIIIVLYLERAYFLQLYTKACQMAKSKVAAKKKPS